MKLSALLSIILLAHLAAQDPMSVPKPGSISNSAAKGLLIIVASEPCQVEIDGQPYGELKPEETKVVALLPGSHDVAAVSLSANIRLRQKVEIEVSRQEAVLLEFESPEVPSRVWRNPADGLAYVLIPRGAFRMGCVPSDNDCAQDEMPPHEVHITRDFRMGVTEFTREGWRHLCAKADVCPPHPFADEIGDEKLPVTEISWVDAAAICRAAGGRLPTEAEWEYAARGGKLDTRYSSGNVISHQDANFSGTNGRDQWSSIAPVASFPANDYGLFDMAGNVWEWCEDWYSPGFYQQAAIDDPAGPISGEARVARGGSWNNIAFRLRASARYALDPRTQLPTTGFRCVLESGE